MRNIIQIASFLLVLFFTMNEAHAQIQNVWVGGMPGRPIDWDVAANWSLQRVPNEFHDVVIPNTIATTFSYPVIYSVVEINSLRIDSGAKLVILKTGELRLNATEAKMSDVLANRGEIENRSDNPIRFHASVLAGDNSLAVAKKH